MDTENSLQARELSRVSPSDADHFDLMKISLAKSGLLMGSETDEQVKAIYEKWRADRITVRKKDDRGFNVASAAVELVQDCERGRAFALDRDERQRLRIEEQNAERREHRKGVLYKQAIVPPRHVHNIDHLELEKNPRWVAVRDDIAAQAEYANGFLVALLGMRGTGKTQLAVSVIRRLCDRLLTCRYVKAMDLFRSLRGTYTPTLKGEKAESEEDVIERWVKWDFLVMDECFPAGTMVGSKRIENIRVGDFVDSYDEDTATFVKRKVLRVFKKNPSSLVSVRVGGTIITCTRDHPIFTENGWIGASSLRNGIRVAMLKCHEKNYMRSVRARSEEGPEMGQSIATLRVLHSKEKSSQRQSFRDDMPPMPVACYGSRVQDAGLLLEGAGLLLSGMPTREIAVRAVCKNQQNKLSGRLRKDETEEPDAQTRNCREGAIGNGWEAAQESRRERQPNSGSTENDRRRARMGNGIHSEDRRWTADGWIPDVLQDRCSRPSVDDSDRGGWNVAQSSVQEIAGSEEGGVLDWERVDYIKVHEPGNNGGFGSLCPDGFVYNLEIEETHTYTANGAVVHNCHQRAETLYEQNTLINLLDRRYDERKCTVIIANQTKEEFAAAMGDSVVSRIHETGDAIICDWPSYRKPGTNWRQGEGSEKRDPSRKIKYPTPARVDN